jgi:23S rRNA pseudouridine2605 synthase
MDEKLQKVLARAGLGSRREIEAWISAGFVKVNGQVAKLGDRVSDKDQLQVRGRRLSPQELATPVTEVILYNKPENELVTRSDEMGRDTVFARLPKPKSGRWIAVGRLDVNTTGLLMLTNNGELANRLMHPSQAIERAYLVRVFGEVSQDILDKLVKGVPLEDGMANFDKLEPLKSFEPTDSINRWYKVTLLEGRNREVRRLWESQGVQVSRLKRIAFANINLPKTLRQGKTMSANLEQINGLLSMVDLPRMEAPEPRKASRPFNREGRLPFAPFVKRDGRDDRDDSEQPRQSLSRARLSTQVRAGGQRSELPTPRKIIAVRKGQAQANTSSSTLSRKPSPRQNWRDNDDDYID